MDEHTPGPAEFAGHAKKLTFQRVLAPRHNDRVVTPADISNQWLEYFVVVVFLVELLYIAEILD
ncbi:MAG: hypothetical protein WC093_07505 [Methanoculleus sp.]